MQSMDRTRISHSARHPRMLDLYFALQKLRSTVSFMNTGAHPDDETSAMLAALGFRDGLDISYACANRGEGGQNDIGTESGTVLGTLRTAEMERAAATLDMRLYWLSSCIDDPITDFRFSKSGIETLSKWGHEYTLQRFASIVRREKPDILCPTFLDIPGQHGHHRAMTQLAHEVVAVAADESVVIKHNGKSLQPWQVAKLYLPAWGGGGTAYDDELPPPEASLTVSADGIDELTGWSWELIGQQSRQYHLTQGMGRWIAAGNERNWPLHLVNSVFDSSEYQVTDNLPMNLSQLADYAQAPGMATVLSETQEAVNDTINAFPQFEKMMLSANSALELARSAQQHCPKNATAQVQHRLDRKITQLSRVIRLSSGIDVQAFATQPYCRPGEQTGIEMELRAPATMQSGKLQYTTSLIVDDHWTATDNQLALSANANTSDPYPAEYFPDSARAPAVKIGFNINGIESHSVVDMVNTPLALADRVANLSSNSVVVNRQSAQREFDITVEKLSPDGARLTVDTPEGWQCQFAAQTVSVQMPQDVEAGLYHLAVQLDGHLAQTERIIHYPHTAPRVHTNATVVSVLVLDVALPESRIAYVGGGNDRVYEQLCAMGLEVTQLDDEALYAGRDLEHFDTLVVGIFAMRTRPVLAQNIQHIHHWIEQGGHLLTLYHRPWDNWHPQHIPPRYLEIGQPSLRFRVTDENAAVTHLLPDHELLNSPNKIGPEDWQHWHKERGLYFAKSWHEDYDALLSMADVDEEPLPGSLLSATIGKGRHTHTSLVLHHQMANLVPGSYRLMANLLG